MSKRKMVKRKISKRKMSKQGSVLVGVSVATIVILFLGCVGVTPKDTLYDFKPLVVSLNRVEVQSYWGWWYFSKKTQPTKGEPGEYGAPLDLAFIFHIKNTNEFPVMMDKLRFTVAFEEFDINTVSSLETMWIPGGKTNQIRIHAISDVRQALLNLLVTGGFKLNKRNMSPWYALEKWWTSIPDFSFPLHVKDGLAIFSTSGITKSVAFSYVYSFSDSQY